MYRGFNLLLGNNFFRGWDFEGLKEVGSDSFSSQKTSIEEKINSFVRNDGSLDGSMMKANWFPQIKANIFISHSHKDINLALALVGWLKETFGLTAFIDSCVWGYANELLKMIDKEYCYQKETNTYNYQKRNYSTSHIHMMLSVALTQMIDNTECLFFLNTPNSITPNTIINQTESPWIYSEIAMSRLIRKKELKEHRGVALMESQRAFAEGGTLNVRYDLPIDHLTVICANHLKQWMEVWNIGSQNSKYLALDILYNSTIQRNG
ncbi:toll/interleukin-1 receptor domain-containing protein [Prevotella melaninogenica]|jgi:hypothetical protein|uniref:toll/interleukin-1 receptor domain-containing protein n=1 Tax=Prevotella melaninogenica TaxID=28132 RepID=UPI001C5DF8B8|nr:toll/interleukin-1 receptor domain-containing protein [Prevotella melaninogenica]MBF1214182.1 hypothetical protein [Fusobacterium periodonticum]MBW4763148.1 toll/interleukin-1 receptor domain-containing protein [Prevotella melaninogenica]